MRRLLGAYPFWLWFFWSLGVLAECREVDIPGKHFEYRHDFGCFHLLKHGPILIRDGDHHAPQRSIHFGTSSILDWRCVLEEAYRPDPDWAAGVLGRWIVQSVVGRLLSRYCHMGWTRSRRPEWPWCEGGVHGPVPRRRTHRRAFGLQRPWKRSRHHCCLTSARAFQSRWGYPCGCRVAHQFLCRTRLRSLNGRKAR